MFVFTIINLPKPKTHHHHRHPPQHRQRRCRCRLHHHYHVLHVRRKNAALLVSAHEHLLKRHSNKTPAIPTTTTTPSVQLNYHLRTPPPLGMPQSSVLSINDRQPTTLMTLLSGSGCRFFARILFLFIFCFASHFRRSTEDCMSRNVCAQHIDIEFFCFVFILLSFVGMRVSYVFFSW